MDEFYSLLSVDMDIHLGYKNMIKGGVMRYSRASGLRALVRRGVPPPRPAVCSAAQYFVAFVVAPVDFVVFSTVKVLFVL